MTAAQLIFYSFAALSVISGLFILFTKNVLHAVLALLAVFLGVSALFVFAGADFLAVTQLVVYVGGVLVLMLFGVMLTNRETGAAYPVSRNKYFMGGIISGGAIFGVLSYLLIKNQSVFPESIKSAEGSTVKILGVGLMSEYVLAFEVAGLLLLMALIGAAVVAGRKE